MKLHSLFALALDPARMLAAQGMPPDPWQRELLLADDREILLNCSRGAGKSRTTSVLALHQALFTPRALVLILARAQRQSLELFRYVKQAYAAIGKPFGTRKQTETQIEFGNGSRIICLPGREDTIRSFQGVSLLLIDEAARVPDDLYRSVRPMLAISRGRIVCLSTPFGQRGFFWKEWHDERAPWKRVRIAWRDCPRIAPDFIERERQALGDGWVQQEYECAFTALEGLVYPDFEQCLIDDWPDPAGEPCGGIDFGFRNPFAAIWGVRDRDDVLWLNGERYLTQTPIQEHAAALPRAATWYADPAGANEIATLRRCDRVVRKGDNDIRAGIAAVTARIRTGRLKVLRSACPNLVAEARLYRYPTAGERTLIGENPIDQHNHALAALRYLISRLDAHASSRQSPASATLPPAPRALAGAPSLDREEHWVPLS